MSNMAGFPGTFSMDALRRGDKAAFNDLFSEFYPALCYFAEKILKDRFAAEEVVQGVMLKVWEKQADFDVFPALKAFLYISTRNASLNYLEKLQRQRKHETVSSEAAPASEEVTLTAIFKAEVMREIYQAIGQLPDKYRRIMEMSYRDELKSTEIAERLNMPLNTVQKQKLRALEALRKLLSPRSMLILMMALEQPEIWK